MRLKKVLGILWWKRMWYLDIERISLLSFLQCPGDKTSAHKFRAGGKNAAERPGRYLKIPRIAAC